MASSKPKLRPSRNRNRPDASARRQLRAGIYCGLGRLVAAVDGCDVRRAVEEKTLRESQQLVRRCEPVGHTRHTSKQPLIDLSGVVLPAFLPTAATLVQNVGGGDPLAVALSINVGSSLVDVSPLSTLGALCVAAVSDPTVSRRLFYQLLTWGLAMTVIGALLCQLFAGVLATW